MLYLSDRIRYEGLSQTPSTCRTIVVSTPISTSKNFSLADTAAAGGESSLPRRNSSDSQFTVVENGRGNAQQTGNLLRNKIAPLNALIETLTKARDHHLIRTGEARM